MNNNIVLRTIQEGKYIIKHGATVRATAKVFGVSKSTVHKDCSVRLFSIDKNLYLKVKQVLDTNLSERHIRGGNATKNKFLNQG